jgi:pyruvate,orthophosphate dikinase
MLQIENSAEEFAVFPFDCQHRGAHGDVIRVLGGKGASLWAMSRLGIPTPPGFTIATSECERFLLGGMSDGLRAAVRAQLERLEKKVGRRLGDAADPLLLSVRSGAAVSMPGMMDTVLNVGLTPATYAAIARQSGDPAFALDTYARFLGMFAATVLGLEHAGDEPASEARCASLYDAIVARVGPRFDDPFEQLEMCIEAVFRSWHSPRAGVYRGRQGLSDALGTAVNVQAMVFGNLDADSATGVVFTRDPSTGEAVPVGDVLFRAQGEAVVAGTHNARPIEELALALPPVYDELCGVMSRLESYYRDMCDIEFTIERGKLWILQARPGKRSLQAAARIAVELATDPRFELSREDAVAMVPREALDRSASTAHRHLDAARAPAARGIGASPGVASGIAVLDPDRAVERAAQGDTIILVRPQTSPADIHGMSVAAGIVTAVGAQMSHAAVVAREWGIPAVCALEGLRVHDETFEIAGNLLREGDVLSIDGTTGDVFIGAAKIAGGEEEDPYVTILRAWRDASG